ncbi:MAG: ATP-binding cassette domain-containing protein [Flavonifractor plautii]
MNKVLELEEVSRTFSSGVFRTHTVRAVDRVSFALERGKTFGLVGNSGCGKTTLSRMITRVLKPSGGRIRFEGEDIARLDRKGSRAYHRRVQIIFQNPEASLDPSMRIRDSLLEAMAIHRLGESREDGRRRSGRQQVGRPTTCSPPLPPPDSGGEGHGCDLPGPAAEPEVLAGRAHLHAGRRAGQHHESAAELQERLGLTYSTSPTTSSCWGGSATPSASCRGGGWWRWAAGTR